MPIIDTPSGLTVAQAMARVSGKLQGARRVEQNRLDGAIADTSADTTVTVEYGQVWGRGTVLEVDRELMYVWSASGTSASVQRGYASTTVGAHSDDSVVRVNPTHSRQDVFDAVLAELRSFNGTGLRAFSTVELTLASSTAMYDLTGMGGAVVTGIHDARWSDGGGDGATHRAKYRFLTNLDTDDFPSGYGILLLPDGGRGGSALRATVVLQFDDFTAEGDVLGDVCALPSYAEGALIAGAAWRLALDPEGRRVQLDAQPARNLGDVPVTSNTRFHESLLELREREIARAVAQQHRLYPPRVKG